MNYFISRGGQQHGPYTLAQLQQFFAQGQIVATDLAWSEGMTAWKPVTEVLGNIPAPPPAAPQAGPAPGPATPNNYGYQAPTPVQVSYGSPGGYTPAGPAPNPSSPMPPDLHWALVLVITMVCGIFGLVWFFMQASFVKKINPKSNAIMLMVLAFCCPILILILSLGIAGLATAANSPELAVIAVPVSILLYIGTIVLSLMAVFGMRRSLLDYYNTVEPINLRLSGVMTFFFAPYYFQYHFSRIAAWKKTGVLVPQQ